jgi:hypothetical protein
MAERIDAKVPRGILDTYVGEYELTPDFTIVVTRKRRGIRDEVLLLCANHVSSSSKDPVKGSFRI